MRLLSSLAVAPVFGSAVIGPSLAVVWEAAFSASPCCWVCSPWVWEMLDSVCCGLVVGTAVEESVDRAGAYLGGSVTSHSAHGMLSEAGGLVHVGLDGGRVIGRHVELSLSLMIVTSSG